MAVMAPNSAAAMLALLAVKRAGQSPAERQGKPLWTPIPNSPQELAYTSEADIIGYGGAAGGGKTWLLLGFVLTKQRRSLILRREEKQHRRIWDDLVSLVPLSAHTNRNEHTVRNLPGGRIIELGGLKDEHSWKSYQGQGHDGLFFDELTEFSELQFRTMTGWLRSEDVEQARRVGATFNPPTSAEGRWVIDFFGPWLDPQHPNPAEPGELRWFVRRRQPDGIDRDEEVPEPVEGETPVDFDGKPILGYRGRPITPRSRTFFPALVSDNPYYAGTDYESDLEQLPEPLRSQLLLGDFRAGIADDEWQVLPTAWVEAAMRRWEVCRPPADAPVDALGVDVAEGGRDETVLQPRYGRWLDRPRAYPGAEFRDGLPDDDAALSENEAKALIPAQILRQLVLRQLIAGCNPQAMVHIDVIGHGTGGGCYALLREGGQNVWPVRSDEHCDVRADGGITFANLRSWLWWHVRMLLDPAGPAETRLALPPDRKLLADLTAATYKPQVNGIAVEKKADIKKRLGRSTDYGDAVVYACRPTAPRHTETTRDVVTKVRDAHPGRELGRDGRWVEVAGITVPG